LAAGQALDHQPGPGVRAKKQARDRLIRRAAAHPDWVLGFADETWWSRLAQPQLHAWTGEQPLHLHPGEVGRDDPDPKALSCYGLLRTDTQRVWVRFVDGRPVSQVTEDFLEWVADRLAAEGKTALLLVWDNASWHISQRVRSWIKARNRRVKPQGGVRIVVCRLPVKSPWLNPIEPRWMHGKKAIVEPERVLTAQEVEVRVCTYYGGDHQEHLKQAVPTKKRKKVA
jgi:DDE superfamily endonuclease